MAEMVTFIAGSAHHKGAMDRIAALLLEEEVHLVREKDNAYDSFAVAVHDGQGLKLGYVPRQDAPSVAKVLDSGLQARAFYGGHSGWRTININWESKRA